MKNITFKPTISLYKIGSNPWILKLESDSYSAKWSAFIKRQATGSWYNYNMVKTGKYCIKAEFKGRIWESTTSVIYNFKER